MQIVAVPLSGKDKSVEAYIIRYLKENNLFSSAQTLSVFDGASTSAALEVLGRVGLEAFTLDKPLFIPINDLMLLGDLDKQCSEPPDKIIFVFESKPSQELPYVNAVKTLRRKGYRFAINYPFDPQNDQIAGLCSYIFLSQRPERLEQTAKTLRQIKAEFPGIEPIATHIYSEDTLNSLYEDSYALYESRFYRVPPEKTDGMLKPEKEQVIGQINRALDESLDFDEFCESMEGDQELITSLLWIFNASDTYQGNRIKTIPQAVSVMGQQEVRRWITAALCLKLGKDGQQEVVRVSLIRGVFAHNLAPLFGLERFSGDLFLIGLLSMVDIMLELPMAQSIAMLRVPGPVHDALADHKGECYSVLELLRDYENANWSSVSRHMIVHDIEEQNLAKAYVDALIWYRNFIQQEKEAAEEKTAATV